MAVVALASHAGVPGLTTPLNVYVLVVGSCLATRVTEGGAALAKRVPEGGDAAVVVRAVMEPTARVTAIIRKQTAIMLSFVKV